MQRHVTFWNGILPLFLGLALILGAEGGIAGRVNAAGEAEAQSVRLPDAMSQGAKIQLAAAKTTHGKTAAQPLPEGIGNPAAARKQYTGKPVSLDLLDADLRNVLRLLADVTGTNIVIEPDVTGKVTLKVEQVPWDQVLDMVLSMNDLGKEQLGNVIRVARQAKLRSEYQQQVEAIRAKQELSETTKDLGELSTVYLAVNFGKPTEIATKLTEAKSERGKVAVDERTSLIIYTDYPARIATARQLLARLDRPTPQVLIEARIITLKSQVSRTLGVDFTFSSSHQTTSVSPVQNFQINPPTAANPYQLGMTVAQLFGKTLVSVDLQVAALETANDARVVAAPRVLTLDNVKAVVTQGIQVPYLKVGDTAANVTGTEFKDATLELQVTPHITPDRKVRMTIDAKQDTVSTTTYGGQPGIDTRKISTELLIDDGNVIVIGGVIDNSSSHNVSSTPGLSKIPLLGRLFKREDSDESRNELLIFISPKIVEVSKPYDRT
ncbi:MAG: type IV pilus secretin PilQ [Desulfobacteraceae bacterium]|nr:type IV pilus secretin PilQ [Desulfobacteraceae bacterium]